MILIQQLKLEVFYDALVALLSHAERKQNTIPKIQLCMFKHLDHKDKGMTPSISLPVTGPAVLCYFPLSCVMIEDKASQDILLLYIIFLV